MKILFAAPAYKPAYRFGGPVHSVTAQAEALVRHGHQVTVFTTNCNLDQDLDVPVDQPVQVDGVEVWYFRREEYLRKWLPFVPYLAKSSGFMYAPAMREALDRIVPQMDLVHTQLPYTYPTYAGSRAAIRHGKPLFYQQRGAFDPVHLQFRGMKKRLYIAAIERPVMQQATGLMALTTTEEASFRAIGATAPCTVLPNGIEIVKYRQQPKSEVLAQWGVPPTATVVLFLGRIHPTKGADGLLEGFSLVQKQFPDAYLVLAGPDEWGLEQSFRARAVEAGWSDRLIFPGMVQGEVKLDLLARADLFALPSHGEGFSMAVLEALASATATLLSPRCHFPEVEAAGGGVTVAPTPETIAAGLASLLGNRERLKAMGQAGNALAARDYTWDRITEKLVQTYQEGLARHSGNRERMKHAG